MYENVTPAAIFHRRLARSPQLPVVCAVIVDHGSHRALVTGESMPGQFPSDPGKSAGCNSDSQEICWLTSDASEDVDRKLLAAASYATPVGRRGSLLPPANRRLDAPKPPGVRCRTSASSWEGEEHIAPQNPPVLGGAKPKAEKLSIDDFWRFAYWKLWLAMLNSQRVDFLDYVASRVGV